MSHGHAPPPVGGPTTPAAPAPEHHAAPHVNFDDLKWQYDRWAVLICIIVAAVIPVAFNDFRKIPFGIACGIVLGVIYWRHGFVRFSTSHPESVGFVKKDGNFMPEVIPLEGRDRLPWKGYKFDVEAFDTSGKDWDLAIGDPNDKAEWIYGPRNSTHVAVLDLGFAANRQELTMYKHMGGADGVQPKAEGKIAQALRDYLQSPDQGPQFGDEIRLSLLQTAVATIKKVYPDEFDRYIREGVSQYRAKHGLTFADFDHVVQSVPTYLVRKVIRRIPLQERELKVTGFSEADINQKIDDEGRALVEQRLAAYDYAYRELGTALAQGNAKIHDHELGIIITRLNVKSLNLVGKSAEIAEQLGAVEEEGRLKKQQAVNDANARTVTTNNRLERAVRWAAPAAADVAAAQAAAATATPEALEKAREAVLAEDKVITPSVHREEVVATGIGADAIALVRQFGGNRGGGRQGGGGQRGGGQQPPQGGVI